MVGKQAALQVSIGSVLILNHLKNTSKHSHSEYVVDLDNANPDMITRLMHGQSTL